MSSPNSSLFNQSLFNQSRRVLKDLQKVNSTTYVDLVGVMVGLERSVGETSDVFLERVLLAAKSNRSSEYIGLLNELNLQFGTKLYHCMSVSGASPFEFRVSGTKVYVRQDDASFDTPLFVIEPDGYVVWKTLSQVAEELEENTDVSCDVLTDAPAIHLVRQSNIFRQVNEEISGTTIRLQKSNAIPGSEVFAGQIPFYEYLTTSVLKMETPVSYGTVSYQYRICPYKVVGSPINILSMTDPDFYVYATGPQNQLSFQALSAVHSLAKVDRSYWTK
jgi:hypothetical protein